MSDVARHFEVGSSDDGRRLDVFLADRLELSRAQCRRLLVRGAVRIEGRLVTVKGVALRAGERVEVAPFTRPERLEIIAEPELPLAVLATGEGWLAVDKPAGMPVHPLEEDERGTVLNAVAGRHPEVRGVGEGALRSGVVHRLDVDTSGAMLVATREEVWRRLREAFRAGQVEKVYQALVLGRLEGAGEVELPLVTARHRPARVRVAKETELARGARVAQLRWRAVQALGPVTRVEVRPSTGFLHQIRAIFAHLGHPLAGDRAYGPPADPTGAARHMLHASHVAFEEISASSPEAEDWQALVLTLAQQGEPV